jgi:hypothetical protein
VYSCIGVIEGVDAVLADGLQFFEDFSKLFVTVEDLLLKELEVLLSLVELCLAAGTFLKGTQAQF